MNNNGKNDSSGDNIINNSRYEYIRCSVGTNRVHTRRTYYSFVKVEAEFRTVISNGNNRDIDNDTSNNRKNNSENTCYDYIGCSVG